MARRASLALLLAGLLSTLVPARGQDFDLSDALGDNDKKPTAPPKRPSADDDGFSLEDALGGGGNNDPVPPNPPKPKPHPNPNQPGSSGGFSDSDLIDGAADGGGGGGGGGGSQKPDGGEQADSPGVVPGIIGAVVVAVAGAISSFIAYQKKKLCFKENADQGEPSPKNQESTSADQTGELRATGPRRVCLCMRSLPRDVSRGHRINPPGLEASDNPTFVPLSVSMTVRSQRHPPHAHRAGQAVRRRVCRER
uniref:CD99 molecule (Xg blood group) n=1 Tax=Ailuropoda melanoleuca TaxID=9646 RepID=A0A7N5KH41_AILME